MGGMGIVVMLVEVMRLVSLVSIYLSKRFIIRVHLTQFPSVNPKNDLHFSPNPSIILGI